jgi:hypothetical protein
MGVSQNIGWIIIRKINMNPRIVQLGVPVRFDPDTRDSLELNDGLPGSFCKVVTNDADPNR